MRTIAKGVMYFSIFMVVLSVSLAFFLPDFILEFNSRLAKTNNLISFLSMLFSLVALLIASIAFLVSTKEPKLEISIIPWHAEEEGPALLIDKETKKVESTRPYTSWEIALHNKGDAAARFPLVDIKFDGLFFGEDTFIGWSPTHHANGLGWYGVQWSPGEKNIVHPHYSIKLPTMYFSELEVEDPQNLKIIVTTVADGIKPNTQIIPVKIIN